MTTRNKWTRWWWWTDYIEMLWVNQPTLFCYWYINCHHSLFRVKGLFACEPGLASSPLGFLLHFVRNRTFWDKWYSMKYMINISCTISICPSMCLPSLLFGCDVWQLNNNNMHNVSVAWNNCFRYILLCCWRECAKPLQYFRFTLPMSYLDHQSKVLFWKKDL